MGRRIDTTRGTVFIIMWLCHALFTIWTVGCIGYCVYTWVIVDTIFKVAVWTAFAPWLISLVAYIVIQSIGLIVFLTRR